ncbi:MAG: glycerate kinase [Syntrophales bacterium]|jgi:hydroxypyruvate reductase|nr:glycerate kinase [Syntrophales bacterium]MDY0044263.1 glycerate kinase [Syntrophales bacterium]
MQKDQRKDIRSIFDAGLDAADPKEAVRRYVRLLGNSRLKVKDRSYNLKNVENIYIVGAGKAASPMALALEEIFGSKVKGGHITTKYGYTLPLTYVSVSEAGHPVPDECGIRGTKRIMSILKGTGRKDILFVVISGGGSALMPMPAEGITLAEKQAVTKILLECGATIHEINAVRKHISQIKGGRLAKLANTDTVITLILSDVIGDNLDVIASGPSVPDESTFTECMQILEAYGIRNRVPESVLSHFQQGISGIAEETPKPGDVLFSNTYNVIIGSSRLSLDAARKKARELGYNTMILSSCIEGEAKEVAKVHAAVAKEIILSGNPLKKPACIISGGETTVTVKGRGIGGRNLEFALASAIDIDGIGDVTILSGGTDGTDGQTNAAGAIVDGQTVKNGMKRGKTALHYLIENDSYRFFAGSDDILVTGPTMTNVMDLRIILVT